MSLLGDLMKNRGNREVASAPLLDAVYHQSPEQIRDVLATGVPINGVGRFPEEPGSSLSLRHGTALDLAIHRLAHNMAHPFTSNQWKADTSATVDALLKGGARATDACAEQVAHLARVMAADLSLDRAPLLDLVKKLESAGAQWDTKVSGQNQTTAQLLSRVLPEFASAGAVSEPLRTRRSFSS
jgi:hypothetical protein